MDNHSPPRPTIKSEDSNDESRGHSRTNTPFESPARAIARPPMPSTPGGMQYNYPSTPSHANVYGLAPGTPSGNHSIHGLKMAAEMNTPVISNANIKYVDDESNRDGSHPSELGLPRTVVDKSTSYGIPSKGLAPRTVAARGGRPQPFLVPSDNSGGLGVMNRLAMPSGLYSDDSSFEEGAANENILRPVELRPTRFNSFQGTTQYEQKKLSQPMTLSTALEHPHATDAAIGSGQYFPNVRNAHGVKELSDTKELDAIFKADYGTPSRSTLAAVNTKIVSPMSVDDDDEEREETPSTGLLASAIPIDGRDWSIPSIRLANHVNTFGMDGSLHSYRSLLSDEEDTIDDGDSSYDGSYLNGDDDDLSLSSKESYDKVRRWRRMSGVLRRSESQNQTLTEGTDDIVMMPPPQVTRTLPVATSDLDGSERETPLVGASILEQRFGDIAIDRAHQDVATTFNPPPMLDIQTALSPDDNAVGSPSNDRTRGRGRRHKKKGRSRSHNSGSAMKWLQSLQQNSASEGGQIIEAASSKFLTGSGGKDEHSDTKALGMPHPLCHSSTIEAGGFAYGIGA